MPTVTVEYADPEVVRFIMAKLDEADKRRFRERLLRDTLQEAATRLSGELAAQ